MDIVAAYNKTSVELLNDPDNPETIANRFILLNARGERTSAQLALARRCAALAPDEFIAVFNRGTAELNAALYQDAIATFSQTLLMPDAQTVVVMQHIGLANYADGKLETAMEWYQRAKELDDSIEIRQSIAITNLMMGNLAKGMFDFECRYHTKARKPIASSGIPRWMGEDLTDKTIIVAHEQGNGDTIQFSRFIPQIKARRVIWSGPESLTGLIADNFKFDAVIGEDGPFDANYYCSPISACGALGIEYSAVQSGPYVTAAPVKLPKRGKLKIGLAWAGNIDYAHDADRSIELDTLAPLLEIPGTAFYSLQVGRGADDVATLGLNGMIADLGSTFKDWRDTARGIAALDLIVSVDSGCAHLAGALGKPVFILLPYSNCWRWMRERTDTPWYSCARLFRQITPRDWSGPVAEVKAAIEERLNGRTQAAAAA